MDFTKFIVNGDNGGLKKYKDDGGDVNIKDPFGMPAIFLAIQLGNKAAVDILIDGGADLTCRDFRGRTFLHYAAEYNQPLLILRFFHKRLEQNQEKWKWNDNLHNAAYSPLEQFIQLLIPFGVPNPLDDDGSGEVKSNEDDETQDETQKPDPLELVHCMMDAALDASVRAVHGETPLHLAAASGSNWCVSVLLSLYGKVGITDNNELSPLHYAVKEDKPQIITTLVNAGCSVDAKDVDGNTPIHYAATKNSVDCIKMLHSLNANLNSKNAIGRTALHLAAELGHRDAVEELLMKGADPNIRDINGWAPLRLAIKGEFQDISQILIEHGTRPY